MNQNLFSKGPGFRWDRMPVAYLLVVIVIMTGMMLGYCAFSDDQLAAGRRLFDGDLKRPFEEKIELLIATFFGGLGVFSLARNLLRARSARSGLDRFTLAKRGDHREYSAAEFAYAFAFDATLILLASLALTILFAPGAPHGACTLLVDLCPRGPDDVFRHPPLQFAGVYCAYVHFINPVLTGVLWCGSLVTSLISAILFSRLFGGKLE